jgi:hypothetical protein
MRVHCVRAALALALCVAAANAAWADDWWMLRNTEDGRVCGPPLEAEGVVLTPEEMLNRFEECKLTDETPSLELNSVMLNCAGNLNQVFIFTKTKESCEALAKD